VKNNVKVLRLLAYVVNYISLFKLLSDSRSAQVRHSLTIEFLEKGHVLLEVHSKKERLVCATVSVL